MEKRRLGANGPEVSAIGLGCWSFGNAYGETSEEESFRTLDAAKRLGVDFLDTANVYGAGISETHIGNYLKSEGGDFVIATKGGIHRDPETGARGFNNDPDYLRGELEKSLKRLGVDKVALYYVHRRDPRFEIETVTETLAGFIQEGLIDGFGYSEIAPHSLRRAHAVHPVMAVQSEYSLWSRGPELGVIRACRDLGVAFVPFSPLGRGMLTGRIPDPATFAKTDFRRNTPRFLEPNFSANAEAVKAFNALAEELGISPAGLAVAWVLTRGDHLIPIPGTRYASHLQECCEAAAFELDDDMLARLDEILPPGFAHGDRYSDAQWNGAERYC